MSTHHSPPGDVGTLTRPRRRWRWWHTLLLVTGVPLVVFAAWVGLVVVTLAGGVDDLFAGHSPGERDPEVVAARRQASRDLGADSDRLTVVAVTPALGPGAVPVGRGEVDPPCREGQHNWKIHDDFDLACDLARVQVVAAADQGSFRSDMVALDAALRAEGWASDLFSMDRVLVDYWDRHGTTASPEPGSRPSMPSYPHGYSTDDLPAAQYTKTVDGQTRTLAVRWAEPESPATAITYAGNWSTFHAADGHDVEPAALIAAIPDDGYAVVVTESVEYFRR